MEAAEEEKETLFLEMGMGLQEQAALRFRIAGRG
jgi:hypothetical protein